MGFWNAIAGVMDVLFGRFLAWLLGAPNTPGAAERYARRLWRIMLIGLIVPPGSVFIGWAVAREDIGFGMSSYPLARLIMGVGMAIGLPILIVVGGAAATVATVLARGFGAKPENADAFVRAYLAVLVWYIFALDLMMLIGVRASAGELFGGIVAGVALGLIAFAWDYTLGWGRAIVFTYFIVRAVLIVTGLTPDGLWMETIGYPVASKVQTLGAAHDNKVMLAAARADVAVRKDASSDELRQIISRMESGKISDRLAATEDYAAWKKKYAGGIRGALQSVADMTKK